ncbi:hypothetical protein [Nocardioides sp. cx-173]|uniref:hypothetical protein n=1 Tax=Nocardioides sp. cx-173 TaxID=2898796 RepID=UPI001E600842|nr:hypothetical protein [Nocardioides sp. cx-173]MCD4524384.1 hypothetical protein [Nocardioides sp. cx-173]UGB43128.1 hypothetical protein LQ940_06275 [Nocardioides sp. cx-173]
MRSRARALAALLVVLASSTPGLVLGGAAAAVPTLVGGCWAYVPSSAPLDAPPASDVSTTLQPWTTVADGGFTLESAGATAVGGNRTVTVSIASGPVVSSTDPVTGTASFLLSLDGEPLAAPLTTTFTAAPGAPVTGLSATAQLPVADAGPHVLRLDAVYLDAPESALRLACNGQPVGVPTGPNPATTPLPTALVGGYSAVASPSVAVTAVADQEVLDTARPGDVVTVSLAGLASAVPATLELCDAAQACTVVGGAVTGPDGSATASFTVAGTAPVGAGTLRVDDGTTQATTALRVLGVQVVAAAEELASESTLVTLTGSGWDPARQVTVRGHTGSDSSTEPTADAEIVVEVDAAGEFVAEFEVADPATTSVIVDQARTGSHIGSVYLISGVIGGAPADPGEEPGTDEPTEEPESPTDSGTGSGSGSGSSSGSGTAAPPLAPPVDIPLPGEIPVVEPPPAAVPESTSEPKIEVSEVRLDGRRTLSELFGGSPQRDLIFLVTNLGESAVSSPVVRVSVGRSDDVEPQLVDAEVGDLDPGDQTVVTVPLELPMAAFGEYVVVGQVGDGAGGRFQTDWTTYPVGLFVLNALALALLGWGVRHRMALRRAPAGAALALPEGDAVVDLAAADAYWARRSGVPAGSSGADGDLAVIDLEAAERWWERSSHAS